LKFGWEIIGERVESDEEEREDLEETYPFIDELKQEDMKELSHANRNNTEDQDMLTKLSL